jgi:SAM-dependent methyltransferase
MGGGVMIFPAVPSLVDHHKDKLITLFGLLGRSFKPEEVAHMRGILARLTETAWKKSPYSRIVARYETDPGGDGGISYRFETVVATVADEYNEWVGSRPQPFFGADPSAKLLDVARSLGPPSEAPILDIGAGEGRNTVPLARLGFPTDAVELSSGFAGLLKEQIEKEGLPARVFQGDVLDPALGLPKGHYQLVLIDGVVVAHFRDVPHMRQLFEIVAGLLAPGGLVLFSVFLALDGFEPDQLTRELEEVFWTVMFTPAELKTIMAGLDLELVDDVSYRGYEIEQKPESWPRTDFFEAYVQGQDLFDLPAGKPPLDLRWLTYKKT